MPTFVKPYGKKRKVTVGPFNDGKTKQAFKDDTDINRIVARYQKTGIMSFVAEHKLEYGFATSRDFRESMEIVAQANSMFEDLPSSLRKRFENDPSKFLDYVQDEKNLDEMYELGLAKKPPVPDPEPPVADLSTATAPEPPAPDA